MYAVHESRMSCRLHPHTVHGNSLMRGEMDMYVKNVFLKLEFHIFQLIGDVQAHSDCEKLVHVVHFT